MNQPNKQSCFAVNGTTAPRMASSSGDSVNQWRAEPLMMEVPGAAWVVLGSILAWND